METHASFKLGAHKEMAVSNYQNCQNTHFAEGHGSPVDTPGARESLAWPFSSSHMLPLLSLGVSFPLLTSLRSASTH